MINEISSQIKPTNSKAKVAFIVLLVLAGFDFIAYVVMRNLGVQKSGFIGLIALVFITAAVYFYTRYVGVSYYYDITFDAFGTPVFVVRQITGKRASTLCRITIADIYKAERETRAESRAHKTPFGFKKYNYVPTFMPETTYRLTLSNRHEKAEIQIEVPEEFISMLMAYAAEARELRTLSEEDEY